MNLSREKLSIMVWFFVFSLLIGTFTLNASAGVEIVESGVQFIEVVSNDQTNNGREVQSTGAQLRYELESNKIPPGIRKKLEEHGDSNLFIIEFGGPIKEEQLDQIEEASVILGDYIPEYSFIVQANAGALEKVKEFKFVENIKPFLPIYKVDPRLFEKGMSEIVKTQVLLFNGYSKNDPNRIDMNYKGVNTSLSEILELALSDNVVYLAAEEVFETYNDEAAKIIRATTVRSNNGLSGNGQIVGVADTGIDRGKNDSTMHLDFQGRIRAIYALGRSNDASDPNGHGTHVAGSILGNGARSNGSFAGMAPEAQLVFQSIMSSDGSLGGLPSNLNTLFSQAYNAGARIHNNSWGSDVNGAYTTSSQQVDQFIWNNKDMSILFASGNAGPNLRTVGSPATAKNAITVGASENYKPSFGSIADNINDIASFSSRGNTADGRVKPDVVAPGTYILSTRSALAPDSSFWANYNSYYAYMGGTSMATPITAGGVALLRENFMKNRGVTPRASLLKAALIVGATDVGLGYPSPHQGWGRVTLDKSLYVGYINESRSLSTSETARYSYSATGGKPLKFSLVWSDYPGNPSASKQLVNDLDLIITAPNGTKYHGNDFKSPFNDSWDGTNNVENIFINSAQSGTYTIEVYAWNVPQGPQNFSLAVVNN
jgi:serine protease AprX